MDHSKGVGAIAESKVGTSWSDFPGIRLPPFNCRDRHQVSIFEYSDSLSPRLHLSDHTV